MTIRVSTPSRICLFGEHLDYLGLEVIALAIDLRFSAEITPRNDDVMHIEITSEPFAKGSPCPDTAYVHRFQLVPPLIYDNKRDYFKSSINVLSRYGLSLTHGYTVRMHSTVPMGKGMSSSSTMIVAFIKALLEAENHPDKDSPVDIAYYAYSAEVEEFGEPGGMMDQYASALGGMVNLDFRDTIPGIRMLDAPLPGVFILFDSLSDKNTSAVLSAAKEPVVGAVAKVSALGCSNIFTNECVLPKDAHLSEHERRNLSAARENYRLLLDAKKMLSSGSIPAEQLGELLNEHHRHLRDGLGISTPALEKIISTARAHGAWGGKVNGSGGGGCAFVFCPSEKAEDAIDAVAQCGYPGRIVMPDGGVRREHQRT